MNNLGIKRSKPSLSNWFVYLVLCKDNTLYCGVTVDLNKRLKKHNDGKGAKYINAKRRPVELVYSEGPMTKSVAFKREYRIKRMSRREKENLIN